MEKESRALHVLLPTATKDPTEIKDDANTKALPDSRVSPLFKFSGVDIEVRQVTNSYWIGKLSPSTNIELGRLEVTLAEKSLHTQHSTDKTLWLCSLDEFSSPDIADFICTLVTNLQLDKQENLVNFQMLMQQLIHMVSDEVHSVIFKTLLEFKERDNLALRWCLSHSLSLLFLCGYQEGALFRVEMSRVLPHVPVVCRVLQLPSRTRRNFVCVGSNQGLYEDHCDGSVTGFAGQYFMQYRSGARPFVAVANIQMVSLQPSR